jgi:hypothetical protein
MVDHSPLSPSSAHRWIECPGSVKLAQKYPTHSSESAQEGIKAHVALAKLWKDCHKEKSIQQIIQNNLHPIVSELTIEERYGSELFFKYIEMSQIPLRNWRVETIVGIPDIHSDMWGTPDAWGYHNNQLFIVDYKFGHSYVEVIQNAQLAAYASGILNYLKIINSERPVISSITFVIIQPRYYGSEGQIRVWEITEDELSEMFLKLKISAKKALSDTAPLIVGAHCRYCPARHACPSLQNNVAEIADKPTYAISHELTGIQLGDELQYLILAQKLIEARLTGLTEQAIGLIKQGERVPGFHMEHSRTRETWVNDIEEILALGETFNVCVTKPADVITPKQAIEAGIPKDIVKQYSYYPPGSPKLVADNMNKVSEVFKNGHQ